MTSQIRTTNNQGSALLMILIGVVLFAALSYTVTQAIRVSSDSSGNDFGTKEKNALNVVDMQQYMESIRMRVYQMTSLNGISENALDFKNDAYLLANGSSISANINASCSSEECHVFSPYAPTGVIPLLFPNIVVNQDQATATLPKNGHGQVKQIAIQGVGTTAPELVFVIHGVKPQFCNEYNAKQGITTSYSLTTTLTGIGESDSTSIPVAFVGAFTTANSFGAAATDFANKKTFCAPAFADVEINRLAIWQVLKVR